MLPQETTVRSACSTCGPVDLPLLALTLVVSHDGCHPRYRYTCPRCAVSVEKRTSARTVELLHGLGANLVVLAADSRLPAPDWTAGGVLPRCAVDEARIDAFRMLLAGIDDVASAAGAVPGGGVG